MSFRVIAALSCASLLPLFGQETRSIISGRVLDPSGAAVPGATVRITNTDTNSTFTLTTNDSGYYEANLLLPGNYRVAAELSAFKQTIRTGLALSVSLRLDVELQLQIGAQAESVSVTGEAPLLETTSASSGRVIDNTTLMNLPVLGNSVTLLTKFTPGIQTGGTKRPPLSIERCRLSLSARATSRSC